MGIATLTLPFTSQSQAGLFDIFIEEKDNSGLIFKRNTLSSNKNKHFQPLAPLTSEKKYCNIITFTNLEPGKGIPLNMGCNLRLNRGH